MRKNGITSIEVLVIVSMLVIGTLMVMTMRDEERKPSESEQEYCLKISHSHSIQSLPAYCLKYLKEDK